MAIIKQKNTFFGGRTTDIQNGSFTCVVTTAKDGIFSGLSTLLWLPSVASTPIGKIEYADKCNNARRHCLHRDIAKRIDDAGQSNLNFSNAIDFALKPYLANGEVIDLIVSPIDIPLNNEIVSEEEPLLSNEKQIAIKYLQYATHPIDEVNSKYQLEVAYLNCFAIDFSTSHTLGVNSTLKTNILDQFYLLFLNWLETKHHLSQEELKKRLVQYSNAIQENHVNGPAWSIGKVFAELTGHEMDIADVMYGSSMWENMVVLIRDFLGKIFVLEED